MLVVLWPDMLFDLESIPKRPCWSKTSIEKNGGSEARQLGEFLHDLPLSSLLMPC